MDREVLINKISVYFDVSMNIAELYMMLLEKPYTYEQFINMGMSYVEGLDILLSKCLIGEYNDKRSGKGKTFFAIDPQHSMPAVLLKEVWERDSEIHSLDVLKDREDIIDLYNKYLILNEILEDLKKIYIPQLPYIKEIIVTVNGRKNVASSIAEQIADVKDSIYAMVSPPHLMDEIVWQTVKEKMDEGINYYRITNFNEIVRHGFEITRLEAETNRESIYIYNGEFLPEKFYILDKQYVIFFERGKEKKNYKEKIQIVKNAALALKFFDTYKSILEKCVDFRTLIPKIQRYREKWKRAIDCKFDKLTVAWLMDIFNNGVFYSKVQYDADFVQTAIKKCKENGLICILDDGQIAINYSIKDVL